MRWRSPFYGNNHGKYWYSSWTFRIQVCRTVPDDLQGDELTVKHPSDEFCLISRSGKLAALTILATLLLAACLPQLSLAPGPDNPLNEGTYNVTGCYDVLEYSNDLTHFPETIAATSWIDVTGIISHPDTVVVNAFLYAGVDIDWSFAYDPANATIEVDPFLYDFGHSEAAFLDSCWPAAYQRVVYRWNVTEALQLQNQNYYIRTRYPTEVWPRFHQLVIVYKNGALLQSKQITINDGSERLDQLSARQDTHFNLGSSGPFPGFCQGLLIVSTMGGIYEPIPSPWDYYENVTFNGELVSDPAGDIWNGSGINTITMDVNPIPGTVNTVSLGAGDDDINWHLAILVVERIAWPAITRDHRRFSNTIQLPCLVERFGLQTSHNVKDDVKLKYSEKSLEIEGGLDNPVEAGFVIMEVDTADGTFFYNMTIQPHARADFWPMAGKSPSHTGLSVSTVPQTNRTRWSNIAGSAIEYSPAVAHDVVFLARNDSITALNETTGAQLWQYSHRVTSSPAFDDGRVFFGTDQGLYALNASTGAFLWQYGHGMVDSSPVINDGKVYFGYYNQFCVVNGTTGQLIWSYTASGPIHTSPAILKPLTLPNPIVFFATENYMYALNEPSGTPKWSQPRSVRSSPTVADDAVFFGCSDGLYALRADFGTPLWVFSTTAPVYSSPAVADGMVFFGCNDHHIYALNATNGATVWSVDVGEEIKASPVVAGERVIWGKLWCTGECRDKSTGNLLWEFGTSGAIAASPVLAYGHVFFGDVNGNFYCIGPEHDVAVNLVTTTKTVVGQGYRVWVVVEAENLGGDTESFYLSAQHGGMIDEYPVVLAPGATTTVPFDWHTGGFDKGNYTISGAHLWAVPGEIETANNILVGGWVFVTIPGDVDGDRYVNIFDMVRMAGVYGVMAPNPQYVANYDIEGDGDTDIFDIVIAAGNYGKSW